MGVEVRTVRGRIGEARAPGRLAVRSVDRYQDRADRLGPTASDARRRLLDMVTAGTHRPGERLGGERDLASELGVSRAALRAALTALERDGIVDRVRGRGGGTFIAGRKVERDGSRIVGVPEMLRDQGFTAGCRVVAATVADPDRVVARALGLPAGRLIVELVRVRLADGSPISLEQARFPADRFPGLLERPLGGSIYRLLEDDYGVRAHEAVEQIEVVGAGDDEAALLATEPGAPLLSLTRTAFDADGTPFEYSRDLFRADRTRIMLRLSGDRPPTAGPDPSPADLSRPEESGADRSGAGEFFGAEEPGPEEFGADLTRAGDGGGGYPTTESGVPPVRRTSSS